MYIPVFKDTWISSRNAFLRYQGKAKGLCHEAARGEFDAISGRKIRNAKNKLVARHLVSMPLLRRGSKLQPSMLLCNIKGWILQLSNSAFSNEAKRSKSS